MSADNYMHIIKVDDKYVVTHRSASAYYADEGWSEENPPLYEPYGGGITERHPEWITPADTRGPSFDTLAEAEEYAYGEWTEYGVSYGFPVRRGAIELESE